MKNKKLIDRTDIVQLISLVFLCIGLFFIVWQDTENWIIGFGYSLGTMGVIPLCLSIYGQTLGFFNKKRVE